ncbi:MAG: SpoIIE family protein phosphatase [Planctomycetaceae bacterium]|nr:SpoIIE family protein phosphatase [Planctomycetaceae bacterium]
MQPDPGARPAEVSAERPKQSVFGDHSQLSRDELRQRLVALENLLDITRHLATDLDLNTILGAITREASEALDCERASLYQYDPKREELFTRVALGLEIAEIRKGLGAGISGDVARTRRLANVPHPAADPRWDPKFDRATGYHTRNILALPLLAPHDGALLGVLELLNKRGAAFTAFDEEVAVAFSQHAAAALDRARLVDEIRERSHVESSLNVARDVQRSFMPQKLPEIAGYELATWWVPHQAVGGDYCDVIRLAEGKFGLVIADVSGHGLGPSLLMASVRAALRALVLDHTGPDELLRLLGRALTADLQEGRFITLALVELNADRHVIEYANAGHAPALRYSVTQDQFVPLEATGLPLGVLDDPEYGRGLPLVLEAGDLVVLCTDGIVEAMNHANEQFGHARLEELVRAHATAPVAELVRRVGESVEDHYVGLSPPDDLTILAVRRNS